MSPRQKGEQANGRWGEDDPSVAQSARLAGGGSPHVLNQSKQQYLQKISILNLCAVCLASIFKKSRRIPLSKKLMLLVITVMISGSVYAQDSRTFENLKKPPYPLKKELVKPLRQLVDTSFQTLLTEQLKRNPTWWKLVEQKRLAIGLVDLSNPYNVRFAGVNRNHMMYAASLPKLAILLAAEQALEEGLIKETPDIKRDMRVMISKSDNRAATRMIQKVGGFKYIESVLRRPGYDLYDPNWGGGLWVGKNYAKGGERYPDPVIGTSHGATATQVCRFYYMLAMGKLINEKRSKHMLEMLANPELHHKFVNTLNKIAPGALIYRKSGTWRSWHADSCLVWGPKWRRYILVAMAETSSGEQILRDLVTSMEEVLKDANKLP